jgi:hypothetical protein
LYIGNFRVKYRARKQKEAETENSILA